MLSHVVEHGVFVTDLASHAKKCFPIRLNCLRHKSGTKFCYGLTVTSNPRSSITFLAMKTAQNMTSERKDKTSTPKLSNADIYKKLIFLKKSTRAYSRRVLHLKRRLHSLTKEVKNMKRQLENHVQKVKKADRIERKMDLEKKKMKQKVLKADASVKIDATNKAKSNQKQVASS